MKKIIFISLAAVLASCMGNVKNDKAEVEKAQAEAAKAQAEAAKSEAELAKLQAEQAKAQAEAAKAQAEQAAAQSAPAAGRKTAVISDPDGYTNVRQRQDAKSPIVKSIYDGQVFYFERIAGSNWVAVYETPSSSAPRIGYMHASRVREL